MIGCLHIYIGGRDDPLTSTPPLATQYIREHAPLSLLQMGRLIHLIGLMINVDCFRNTLSYSLNFLQLIILVVIGIWTKYVWRWVGLHLQSNLKEPETPAMVCVDERRLWDGTMERREVSYRFFWCFQSRSPITLTIEERMISRLFQSFSPYLNWAASAVWKILGNMIFLYFLRIAIHLWLWNYQRYSRWLV